MNIITQVSDSIMCVTYWGSLSSSDFALFPGPPSDSSQDEHKEGSKSKNEGERNSCAVGFNRFDQKRQSDQKHSEPETGSDVDQVT